MAKYNFKKFFSERLIHNSEYFTNGHILLNKSLLTASQEKFINSIPQDDERIKQINYLIEQAKNSSTVEFIPTHITKDGQYMVMQNDLAAALTAEYYYYLTSKKCRIYVIDGETLKPFAIYNDEFMGIVLPVRNLDYDLIPITEYEKQLEEEEKQKTKEKGIMGKCIHTSGIERKQMIFLKEIQGIQFYALRNRKEDIDPAYAEVKEGYLIPICDIRNIEDVIDKVKSIDLHKHIEEEFNSRINKNYFVSLGVAEYLDRLEEGKEHNSKLAEERKKEGEEKERQRAEEQRQQEEAERLEMEKEITEAKQKFIAEEYIDSDMFLTLCDRYNIKLPIKTRGWVKKSLNKITPSNYYYSGKNPSGVVLHYAGELKEALKYA